MSSSQPSLNHPHPVDTNPTFAISGAVLTIGEPCAGGLSLWVLEGGEVRLRQGCDGGEGGVVESGDLAVVVGHSTYALAITLSGATAASLAERLAPLAASSVLNLNPQP